MAINGVAIKCPQLCRGFPQPCGFIILLSHFIITILVLPVQTRVSDLVRMSSRHEVTKPGSYRDGTYPRSRGFTLSNLVLLVTALDECPMLVFSEPSPRAEEYLLCPQYSVLLEISAFSSPRTVVHEVIQINSGGGGVWGRRR